MGLEQLNFEGQNKVEVAIARVRQFVPPEGYYLAFSGGKDSVVIYDLAVRAGVKFDAHYHLEISMPEQVQFVRDLYPDVELVRPLHNFWKLMETKGFPMRTKRWCCEYLKEWGGGGRIIVTGVRAAESIGRRKRKLVDRGVKTRFNEAPRAVVHPIIDWDDSEVWEYIKLFAVPYCSLYDEGFDRLGCVMCPLTVKRKRIREMERWPRIAQAWRNAFHRLYENKKERYSNRWPSADDMFNWWMGLDFEETIEEEQCTLFM